MNNAEAVNWLINITADIGKVEHQDLWHYAQALSEIREMLEDAPTIEPQRMSGKWIPIQRGFFNKEVTQVKCDQCGNLLDLIGVNCGRGDANFCPNCGADMRGEE